MFVVDPAAGDVLAPTQAAGLGVAGATGITGLTQWFKVTTGMVTENTTTPGTYLFTAADTTSLVAWRCVDTVGNFPAAPGLKVSFRAPTAIAAIGTVSVGIDLKKADSTYLSTLSATSGLISGTVPANAAYLTLTAKPGTAGSYSLASACLTYGGTAENGVPGDGLHPMSVTDHSDIPGRPLPYRTIGLDLVEVSSATG